MISIARMCLLLLLPLPVWCECQCPVYNSFEDCKSCADLAYNHCYEEARDYLHCPDNLTDRSFAMYRLLQCKPAHEENILRCTNSCP